MNTTTEIAAALDDAREKTRILSARRDDTAAKLDAGKRQAGAAIAAGKEDPDLRRANRDLAEELDEISLGLESLNRERASLEGRYKQAEIREAAAEADRLAAEATETLAAVASALSKFIDDFVPLVNRARSAMSLANGADYSAKAMAPGERTLTLQTPRVSFPSGLELIIDGLLSAVSTHNSGVRLAAGAAGRTVDDSTNFHSVR